MDRFESKAKWYLKFKFMDFERAWEMPVRKTTALCMMEGTRIVLSSLQVFQDLGSREKTSHLLLKFYHLWEVVKVAVKRSWPNG